MKIFGITGDCPALKLVLNFVGHGGYWCCWLCYLKGVHDGGKRQYRCELPIEYRTSSLFMKKSLQAERENRPVLGHYGVSPLHKILDVPLPQSIIIDYLHATLLGHAKAITLAIYNQLKPGQRSRVDVELKNQSFPHFFNRKMRAIGDFGHVKASEVRNLLLYGLIPIFQEYLSIQQTSHLALFRLFDTSLSLRFIIR